MASGAPPGRPRVLFVSRERHVLPLPDGQRRKWDAVGEHLDYAVLAAARRGSPTRSDRFELVPPFPLRLLDGLLFYLLLPLRVARLLRRLRPDAVVAQNVHETVLVLAARRLAGSRARVVLDLHGDWRVATRLYGSPVRRLLSPLGDLVGPAAVRGADAVRALSATTSALVRAEGREPDAVFPAYVDVEAFRARPPVPLPERPAALFVGVLERYKGFDVLAAAWREVAAALPDARLAIVGRGRLAPEARRLVADLPGQASWEESLAPGEVADALDAATVLVLPSRSEGLPRVAIEAFCRGRAVVGGRAGGIPDIVADGATGLLVEAGDVGELAAALRRCLSDPALAQRLGDAAAVAAGRWALSPDEYAAEVAGLVRAVLGGEEALTQ